MEGASSPPALSPSSVSRTSQPRKAERRSRTVTRRSRAGSARTAGPVGTPAAGTGPGRRPEPGGDTGRVATIADEPETQETLDTLGNGGTAEVDHAPDYQDR